MQCRRAIRQLWVLTEKRSGIELLGLTENIEEHDTDLRWCHSDIQLADGMTKKKNKL